MKIRIHSFEPFSRANGPGLRAVIWFQGCTLGCSGCFNQATHDSTAGQESDTEIIAAEILALGSQIEGITLSGGEPFQQPEALLDLVKRMSNASRSVLVFSGYTIPEIQRLPLGPEILQHIDVLVAGRYVEAKHSNQSLLGSANQGIRLLTTRYTNADLANVPRRELIIHRDGSISASGLSNWKS